MSEGTAGAEGQLRNPEPLCILDAVICVHFVAANAHRILVDVLRRAGLVLMVPQEVVNEVTGKVLWLTSPFQSWASIDGPHLLAAVPQ